MRVYDTRDRRAAQKLVDLLDDPSSAVRMYAILALRGLTGEDFGYRYYDSEGARAASVQRWRDGVRAGIVVLRLAPPAVPPGESGPFQPDATTEGGATSRAAGGASGSR